MRSFVLLCLAACGGGGSSNPPTVIDVANTRLVATREDGAAWKAATPSADGKLSISIDGPMQIATVCDSAGTSAFFNFYTIFVGPGVEDLDIGCRGNAQTVTVDIDAPATADVFIGANFTMGQQLESITAGTYDIVAVDSSTQPPRFEIKRDVVLSADTTITLSPSTPMIAGQATVTGAGAGETATPRSLLYTAKRTFVPLFAGGGTVWLFPPTALVAGDRMTVSASTTNEAMGSRSASHQVTGGETTFTLALPPYLTAVSVANGDEPNVTFTGDPRFTQFYFGVNTPGFDKLDDVVVFPEWAEAGGSSAIEIPDGTQIPGWQPAWSFTPTQWTFFATHDSGADSFSASKDGDF